MKRSSLQKSQLIYSKKLSGIFTTRVAESGKRLLTFSSRLLRAASPSSSSATPLTMEVACPDPEGPGPEVGPPEPDFPVFSSTLFDLKTSSQCYETFYSRNLRLFAISQSVYQPGRRFQPCLTFVCKAVQPRAHPRVEHL